MTSEERWLRTGDNVESLRAELSLRASFIDMLLAEIERLTKEYDEEVTSHDIEEKDLKQKIERLEDHLEVACVAAGFTGIVPNEELNEVIEQQDPKTGKLREIERLEGELRATQVERDTARHGAPSVSTEFSARSAVMKTARVGVI